jgi:alpha-L-fucosidase
MWPSKVNNYNITDATPFKRDPMRELKEACTKYGLKFGFYYSQAQDWGDAEGVGNDWDYKNPARSSWWEANPDAQSLARTQHYVESKVIPQLHELVQNYHPDIFWFDTPIWMPASHPTPSRYVNWPARSTAPKRTFNDFGAVARCLWPTC